MFLGYASNIELTLDNNELLVMIRTEVFFFMKYSAVWKEAFDVSGSLVLLLALECLSCVEVFSSSSWLWKPAYTGYTDHGQ